MVETKMVETKLVKDTVSIPEEVGVLPLKNVVIYPSMVVPLIVGHERSTNLIDDAVLGNKLIGTFAQKDPQNEDPRPDELYLMGTACSILQMLKLPDGTYRILVQGLSRIEVLNYTQEKPYLKAKVIAPEEKPEDSQRVETLVRDINALFQKLVSTSPHLSSELQVIAMNIKEPGKLADFIASNFNLSQNESQELLETLDIKSRLERVTFFLSRELEMIDIQKKIQNRVQEEVGKGQREYLLREQLKAIQRELGEGDEREREIQEIRKKIESANMPDEARKEAERELNRLSSMSPLSAEYPIVKTYLDWLTDLPWSASTEDNLDIERAKWVLDEDHYDLDEVKERIIEYLAVRKLKKDMKGPILCFVGPPGVGKTSLGKSIARALGRKFVRISLGGVRDEAEIRGHRRTYIGALPGRIIQGIRKVESKNPVFMLDEVDKIGVDFRGDPSAALLEVLDPEQNSAFADHYLSVPFDLSKVMFITTANILDTIPPPLLDRMEILRLPGYTEEEKVEIAKRYLIPRQLAEHGITENEAEIEEKALRKIVRDYTREAGVRNLEREIATILRKIAKDIAAGKKKKRRVTLKNLDNFLGKPRYIGEIAERTRIPGIATGLAWTPTGGDILFVEATRMKGEKELILTGQLGEVMKESAQAALSYIRSRAGDLDIREDFFEDSDIHIHVPAGAIPKDGPSAGITIVGALASLLTGKPIKPLLAMTGEITLRGKVTPVGGIKEKILAASRSGIKEVILPKGNEKYLDDIPENIKKKLKFHLIETIDEAIRIALGLKVKEKKRVRA